MYDLLLGQIGKKESFAISGTPGIGKSLFFVYVLYRLIKDTATKSLSLKPKRVIYQWTTRVICYDLQRQTVTQVTMDDAEKLVLKDDTFYVIDGRNSEPLLSTCVVMFISSPCSEWYKFFRQTEKGQGMVLSCLDFGRATDLSSALLSEFI